jgi:Zn-dependent protease with chaperone function
VPSALPGKRVEAIRRIFRDVAREAAIGDGARILFRGGGPLGANAVALPAGIVVVTDELVSLAKDNGEIAAVLAHEAGHVRGRHGLRHLLQNSMTVLLVSAATGDLASISSLAAAAPTMLVDAKYSRDFEREADAAAARYLRSRGIPLRKYADILSRMEADRERYGKGERSRVSGYLSTHPSVRERIRGFSTPR